MVQSNLDIRTFIAISLSEEMQDQLSSFQRELLEFKLPVRWVKPDNIHLTLKFIGPTREKDCSTIAQIIDKYARRYAPFELDFGSAGVFPGLKKPRVLWVGLGKGIPEASSLQELIDKTLEHELRIRRESRTFKPHLTLGRFKAFCNAEKAVQKLDMLCKAQRITMNVKSIRHYKSILKPTGAEYHVLHEAFMKSTNS